MVDIIRGAATIAAGIILAALILAVAWKVMQPAQTITIELATYACTTDGRKIECSRK